MAKAQKLLIYVEDENIEEAKFMSRSFVDKATKKRAYINTMGAEVIKNYLSSEGFDVFKTHNLHSVSRILERNDIADILLPNIHIDVRVVFDKDKIFIPKSHFEKEILPDLYVVVKFDDEFKTAEILGHIKPDDIDKKSESKNYYYVTSDQLKSAKTFIKQIKNATGKAERSLTESEMLKGRQLAISLSDHDISAYEEREFLELMLISDALRESVLEFDNFETLAYSSSAELEKSIDVNQVLAGAAVAPELAQDEVLSEEEDISISEDETVEEETLAEGTVEDNTENDLLGDDMLEEAPVEEIDEAVSDSEPLEVSDDLIADDMPTVDTEPEPVVKDEPQVVHQVIVPPKHNELSVDDILDRTIASINTTALDGKPVDTAGAATAIGGAAVGMAAAGAAAAGAAEIAASGAVASGAAEVADTLADTIVESAKEDVSDNAGTFDEDFDTPKDLDEIDRVDSIASAEKVQEFEQETVDLQDMDVVKSETFNEEDLDTLSDIESLDTSAQFEKQDEFIEVQGISESEVVDLPMTDYVINEDGSTPLDDFVPPETVDETELLDMPPLENAIDENVGIDDTISQVEDLMADTLSMSEDGSLPVDEDSLPIEEVSNLATGEDTLAVDEIIQDAEEVSAPDLTAEDVVTDTVSDEVADVEAIPDAETLLDEETLSGAETLSDEEILSDAETVVDADTISEVAEQAVEVSEEGLADTAETAESAGEYDDFNIEDFEDMLADDTETPESAATSEEQTDIVEETAESTEEIGEVSDDILQDIAEEPVDSPAADDGAEVNRAAAETSEQADDWMDSAEFVDMEDLNAVSDSEMITEPDAQAEQDTVVQENSSVISSKDIAVGEIPIDINKETEVPEDNTPLGDLYNNDKIPGESIMSTPGTMGKVKKNNTGAVVGIFGALIVIIIVGVIGFFVSGMLKAPKEEAPQPITDDNYPTSPDNGVADQNTLNVNQDNVVNMDNNTNALASTAGSSVENARKTGTATAFVDIKKLTWEVPDYISYDNNFKAFFQSSGKTLKLALVSDLLLAKDFIYSSPVKVSITFNKDGSFKSSQILNSSGSTQIDSIVLQTVNQTLKGLKAPHSLRNDESTTAILKIYF